MSKNLVLQLSLFYVLFCLCTTCTPIYAYDAVWDQKIDSVIEIMDKKEYTEVIPVIKNDLELLKNNKLNGDLTNSDFYLIHLCFNLLLAYCYDEIEQLENAIQPTSETIKNYKHIDDQAEYLNLLLKALEIRQRSYGYLKKDAYAIQDNMKILEILNDIDLIKKTDISKENQYFLLTQTLYNIGVNYYKTSAYDKAIEHLNAGLANLSVHKNDSFDDNLYLAKFRLWLGKTHEKLGNKTKANENFNASVTVLNSVIEDEILENNLSIGYCFRGINYYHIFKYDKALLDFNKSISNKWVPESFLCSSLLYRGKCYFKLQQFDLASSDFLKANNYYITKDESQEWLNKIAIRKASLVKFPIKYPSKPFFANINNTNVLIPESEPLVVDIQSMSILYPYDNISIQPIELRDGEEMSPQATYVCSETGCKLLIRVISDVEIEHLLLFGAKLSPEDIKLIMKPKLRKEFSFKAFIPSSVKFENRDFSIVTKGGRNFEYTLLIKEVNDSSKKLVCNIIKKLSNGNLADEL